MAKLCADIFSKYRVTRLTTHLMIVICYGIDYGIDSIEIGTVSCYASGHWDFEIKGNLGVFSHRRVLCFYTGVNRVINIKIICVLSI